MHKAIHQAGHQFQHLHAESRRFLLARIAFSAACMLSGLVCAFLIMRGGQQGAYRRTAEGLGGTSWLDMAARFLCAVAVMGLSGYLATEAYGTGARMLAANPRLPGMGQRPSGSAVPPWSGRWGFERHGRVYALTVSAASSMLSACGEDFRHSTGEPGSAMYLVDVLEGSGRSSHQVIVDVPHQNLDTPQ